jgi:hypothetical protein
MNAKKAEVHMVSRNTAQPHLLLQTPEGLLDLLVQLIELARDILLALCIGRFELHLRELERDIACRIPDLRRYQLVSGR